MVPLGGRVKLVVGVQVRWGQGQLGVGAAVAACNVSGTDVGGGGGALEGRDAGG